MPLFEYQCRGCGRRFEALVTAGRAPACPGCQSAELQKLLSSPGMVGRASRRSDPASAPACRAQGGHCGCTPDDN